jgi:uracil-DNA glycosylase
MSGSPPRGIALARGTWSYDGSLEGLLVLAHRAYAESRSPEAVANALAVEGELFALLGPSPLSGAPLRGSLSGAPLGGAPRGSESRPSEPGAEGSLGAAAESASSVLRAFSGELFDSIISVWMSEEPLELPLFRLCALAGLRGPDALADHGNPDLRAVLRASRRVRREIDRLSGLARFSPRSDGLFCAPLEPDSNIAAALLPHFARRFGPEDFALVDVRRRLAFARRGGRFESAAGEDALAYLPDESGSGDEDLALWRRYFKATENPSRKNPELQRRLMPRRYWRYLPEIARLSGD